jgi:hypothetical protein
MERAPFPSTMHQVKSDHCMGAGYHAEVVHQALQLYNRLVLHTNYLMRRRLLCYRRLSNFYSRPCIEELVAVLHFLAQKMQTQSCTFIAVSESDIA